jgi:hypothetical protein
MGFNPLKLLKGAAKVIGGAIGIDVEGALEALSDNPDPEVQAALQQYEVQMRELSLKELQTEIDAKVGLMTAEIKSEDAFVRRARPTGLYMSYLVIAGLVAATIAGVTIDVGEIIALTAPIMGYSGWYSYNRSQDKKNGNGR